MRIAALLTCHNRREKTLSCLVSLLRDSTVPGVDVSVILVDDGCTDGTAEAVRQAFPAVEIVVGDGKLYWNGGMRRAIERARTDTYDAHLWLNDDTVLASGALVRMVETYQAMSKAALRPVIVVGTTRDSRSNVTTYGGCRRLTNWHPLKFETIDPTDNPQRCDTFNGNCVLIPTAVVEVLGNLDPSFAHAMGDTDYGLRAVAAGFQCWVAPDYVGVCVIDHPVKGTFRDTQLGLRERWRHMMSPKGIPPRAWRALTRKHGGHLWFVFWVWPYLRVVVEGTFMRWLGAPTVEARR